jgi:DNA-binding NtrC family response regulator
VSGAAKVLIAEDDPRALESLRELLREEGYEVEAAAGGAEAWRLLGERKFEALLLDVRMPGMDGLKILGELPSLPQPPAALVMTAYGSSSIAIEAMKLGAYDYLAKPLRFDELLIQLERAIAARRQVLELETFRGENHADDGSALIGESAAMRQVYKRIGQVAATDSTVLILGESGTGKELVARAIHAHGARGSRRMVSVNCAAIPDALLEAELFGHEKGAFTGAAARRRGRFELADGGTIFLDEIGDLSAAMQAKLLRVLQDRSIERLGSEQTIKLDVRIIAATNRDLEAAVAAGKFREDLFYRLNVVAIRLPPLRERREDIAQLAPELAARIAAGRKLAFGGITEEAIGQLTKQAWPGNVRELEHCLERALILGRGAPLAPAHLSVANDLSGGVDEPFADVAMEEGMHALVARLERQLIERALKAAGGNRSQAAELLKISRRLLYDKIREHKIGG